MKLIKWIFGGIEAYYQFMENSYNGIITEIHKRPVYNRRYIDYRIYRFKHNQKKKLARDVPYICKRRANEVFKMALDDIHISYTTMFIPPKSLFV